MIVSLSASLPVLIIDDEADQASINTGGNRAPAQEEVDLGPDDLGDAAAEGELNPSAINSLIRSLVRSFNRVSYVAYTGRPACSEPSRCRNTSKKVPKPTVRTVAHSVEIVRLQDRHTHQ